MKILITGASGFLGAHLVRAFAGAGCSVLAGHRARSDLARLRTLAPESTAIAFVPVDFDHLPALAELLHERRPAVVVNAAAYGVNYGEQSLDQAIFCNITATSHLVDAAAACGVGRFIHIGSAYEYGIHNTPITESTALAPTGLYGATKAAGSLLALARAQAAAVPLCVVRPFALYGPLEGPHKFVPQIFAAARAGTPLECSPGEQCRDYSYVGDVAAAIVQLATATSFPDGRILNLASGTPITLRQLGQAAIAAAGAPASLIHWGARPYRPDEVMCMLADVGAAATTLGWRATTPLAAGLRDAWRAETLRAPAPAPANEPSQPLPVVP